MQNGQRYAAPGPGAPALVDRGPATSRTGHRGARRRRPARRGRARSSACSGPTARARRRSSRSWPGCAGPTRAGSRSAASTWSRRRQRARRLIGLAPQDTGVYLAADACATTCGSSPGSRACSRAEARRAIDEVAGALGLTRAARPARRRNSRAASGAACTPRSRSCTGPRSCCSTSRRPAPTCGRAARSSSSCASLADDGSAVVYSTHYLHEIETLDADVAFIDRGRIVARAHARRAGARHGSSALELTFVGAVPGRRRGSTARSSTERRCASRRRSRPRARRNSSPRSVRRAGSLRSIEIVRPEPRVGVPHGHRAPVRPDAIDRRGGGRVISPRRLGVILAHELRLAARDPLPVMVLIVFPIITMAFLKPAFRPALVQSGLSARERRRAGGARPGGARARSSSCRSSTFAFFSEFGWMTWDRLRASPATSLEIVLGKATPARRDGDRAVRRHPRRGRARSSTCTSAATRSRSLPLVVVFSICLVLLGVAVTAICRTAQQANAFAYRRHGAVRRDRWRARAVQRAPALGAGTIAPATPTYWAMRGFRSVDPRRPRASAAMAAPIAVLAAMGVLFAVIALRRLRFDETKVAWAVTRPIRPQIRLGCP